MTFDVQFINTFLYYHDRLAVAYRRNEVHILIVVVKVGFGIVYDFSSAGRKIAVRGLCVIEDVFGGFWHFYPGKSLTESSCLSVGAQQFAIFGAHEEEAVTVAHGKVTVGKGKKPARFEVLFRKVSHRSRIADIAYKIAASEKKCIVISEY